VVSERKAISLPHSVLFTLGQDSAELAFFLTARTVFSSILLLVIFLSWIPMSCSRYIARICPISRYIVRTSVSCPTPNVLFSLNIYILNPFLSGIASASLINPPFSCPHANSFALHALIISSIAVTYIQIFLLPIT